jgi:alpha/beta superfamily hydrolase
MGKDGSVSNPIRANSILPAKREDIELTTADGLTLVGELALPVDRPPVATLVCLHPLPTHAGSMDSHVYRKAAWRLPALAGIAVLRFNFRGTSSDEGTSEGVFDDGGAERYDLAAALDLVESEESPALPAPWVVGWSFGTEVTLRWAHEDPSIVGAILLSPPLHRAGDDDLRAWAASGKPLTVLVPELDDYLRPAQARERFALVPQAAVLAFEGVKHLWVGERAVRQALTEIVRVVAPRALPLPTAWPSTTGGA